MPDVSPGPDAAASLALARAAAGGDSAARAEVARLADPVIRYQTEQFCKRFCHDNRFRYACTLQRPWGSAPPGAPLCEWGNASYGWMLDDLCSERRLGRFEGRGQAGLGAWFYQIANSLPFYERWKNWRFGRRVHVPAYVAELGPLAARVFLALRNGDASPLIAQQLGCAQAQVDELARRIVGELAGRGRLHLLDPPRGESLSAPDGEGGGGGQRDLPSLDPSPEQAEWRTRLGEVWPQLSVTEQFVLEAMVIDEREANDVLQALALLDLPVAEGTPASATNRQQLYYFRRKTLARLARLMEAG